MGVSSTDWLSTAILIILAIDFVIGFKRGLVRQVFSLASIIIAGMAGVRFYREAGLFVLKVLPGLRAPWPDIIGFVIVLLGTMIVVDLLGHGLTSAMKAPGLSIINGFGGAAFRVARTCLLISITLVVLVSFNAPAINKTVEGSPLAAKLLTVAPRVWGELERFIPKGLEIPGIGGRSFVNVKRGNGRSI